MFHFTPDEPMNPNEEAPYDGGYIETNDDDLTFEAWMEAVDAEIQRVVGLTTSDLADCCFADMWSDGCPPTEAAAECLRENDAPEELINTLY
jgi:hypothetical protein